MLKHRIVIARGLSALLLLGVGLGTVRAEEASKDLASFAKGIKALLDEEKQKGIAVGEFTSPPRYRASAGPSFQQDLIRELEKLKVVVDADAELYVKGAFLLEEDGSDKAFDQVALRVEAEVYKSSTNQPIAKLGGRIVPKLKAQSHKSTDIVKKLGPTGYLGPKANAKDRNEHLGKQIKEPKAYLAKGRIQTRKGSPYGVEIRVKDRVEGPAVARAARNDKGRAFVNIKRGELYEIWAYNDSPYDAAVSITIDGLDVFEFSDLRHPKTGKPRYTHYIVAPGKYARIVGWHRTNDYSSSFKVTAFADSAAAKRLRSSAAAGTITVCFHAAWEGSAVPEDEKGARSFDGNGTAQGPPVKRKVREVKRTIGVLREFVSVRYNK